MSKNFYWNQRGRYNKLVQPLTRALLTKQATVSWANTSKLQEWVTAKGLYDMFHAGRLVSQTAKDKFRTIFGVDVDRLASKRGKDDQIIYSVDVYKLIELKMDAFVLDAAREVGIPY